MTDIKKLKRCLDRLATDYDVRYLDSDPVGLVHSYRSPVDREVAGFIVSVLAYGSAVQIRKSAKSVLKRAGSSPADFARTLTPGTALETFRDFKYRWTDGGDIAFLFWRLGRIIEKNGSVGAYIKTIDNPGEKTAAGVMSRFSESINNRYSDKFRLSSQRSGSSYLVPSPADGSACKRLAMYFRWMVRGPDGVDFGLWDFISPSRLIIPVDRHIARMGRLLGLTTRQSADWKMALDITESLCHLDPQDPVRYDFALVRRGILGECTSTQKGNCMICTLREVCLEAS